MSFLGVWIGSAVLSYLMEFISELRIFKSIADQGYKVNFNKFNKAFEDIGEESSSKIMFFIPIVNIFYVLLNSSMLTPVIDDIIDQFDKLGVIEEMSDYEKNEYNKKPTLLNSIFVPLKYDVLYNDSNIYSDMDGNKIRYVLDGKSGLKIIDVKGPIAQKSQEEQEEFILKLVFEFNNVKQKHYIGKIFDNTGEEIDKQIAKLETLSSEVSSDRLEEIKRQKAELLKEKEDLVKSKDFIYGMMDILNGQVVPTDKSPSDLFRETIESFLNNQDDSIEKGKSNDPALQLKMNQDEQKKS